MVFITLSALYQYKQCTQFRLNWYRGSREKATNVQKFTNDVRRTPTEKQVAIRHLTDSDDIKGKNHFGFLIYFIPVNIKSIDTYFINGSQIFLKSYLHVYLTYQNSLFRYWPLVSSHSALKDLSESATKTVAFFLLQCPHKLYGSSALNVSSKRTDVIFLVKP